jgi:1-acyl-sn-glycerol-3-phosphate acyltransferase
VELVPVGVAYEPGSEFVDETFVQHLTRMAQRPRTHVALCIGEPRDARGDRDALASEMQNAVQALVLRARAALGATGNGATPPLNRAGDAAYKR